MPHNIEVARLLNRTYNSKTGRLLLTFEVTDPAMKRRLLRDDVIVRLVLEEKECRSTSTNAKSANTDSTNGLE